MTQTLEKHPGTNTRRKQNNVYAFLKKKKATSRIVQCSAVSVSTQNEAVVKNSSSCEAGDLLFKDSYNSLGFQLFSDFDETASGG